MTERLTDEQLRNWLAALIHDENSPETQSVLTELLALRAEREKPTRRSSLSNDDLRRWLDGEVDLYREQCIEVATELLSWRGGLDRERAINSRDEPLAPLGDRLTRPAPPSIRAERTKPTQIDNVLYLTQLRASAHDQTGKDGYTWISPEHVLNLLNLIEAQRVTIASIRAEGSAERAKLEAALREALEWRSKDMPTGVALRLSKLLAQPTGVALRLSKLLAQPAESGATFRPSVERALQRCADLDTEPTGAKP